MTGEVVSLETVWTCVETAFRTHPVLLDIFFQRAEGDSDQPSGEETNRDPVKTKKRKKMILVSKKYKLEKYNMKENFQKKVLKLKNGTNNLKLVFSSFTTSL